MPNITRYLPQSLRLIAITVVAQVAAIGATTPAAAPNNAPWPTKAWSRSTPESQGVSSEKLAQAVEVLREHKVPVHDIVIVRHGYLVFDANFFPYRKEEPHDLASVTKSFTSTLVGIAIDKGIFRSVDTPMVEIFPEAADAKDARKQKVTLATLLEMRSGLNCINNQEQGEKTLLDMLATPDWVKYTLGLPMAAEPGAQFVYCSSGMHVLSGALFKVTGASQRDFGQVNLFAPLGIPRPDWSADAQGRNTGWGGLELRPTDMAKLGYLMLRHGVWDGRQIVSRAWVDAATRPEPAGGVYGYGWWVGSDVAPFAFSAGGRGSQAIAVDPERDLVAVVSAAISRPQDAAELKRLVLDAIVSDKPLPADPAGQAHLASALTLAARPPTPHAVQPLPRAAAKLSGRQLVLASNPFGVTSLTLTFSGNGEAAAELTYSGVMGRLLLDPLQRSSTTGRRPLGLDGVPRLSRAAGHGFLVALDGDWTNDTTFGFHYNTVAGINNLAFNVAVTGAGADVTIEEPTLGMKSEVHAQFAPPEQH